jgi:hypothetical protein
MTAIKTEPKQVRRMKLQSRSGGETVVIVYRVFQYMGLTCCLHQHPGQIHRRDVENWNYGMLYAVSEHSTGVSVWRGETALNQDEAISYAKAIMYQNRGVLWERFVDFKNQYGVINE